MICPCDTYGFCPYSPDPVPSVCDTFCSYDPDAEKAFWDSIASEYEDDEA